MTGTTTDDAIAANTMIVDDGKRHQVTAYIIDTYTISKAMRGEFI